MKRSMLWFLLLLPLVFTYGCASDGVATLDEMKELCNAIVPCEPCPKPDPCPPCPPATTVPEEPVTVPDETEGCDRDGLPPSERFIWKPQSDNDGKLAVITPASLSCERGVTVFFGKDNKKTEKGVTNGVRANGCRLSWRFKNPGSNYGKNIKVVCFGGDGNRVWQVGNGATRYEK